MYPACNNVQSLLFKPLIAEERFRINPKLKFLLVSLTTGQVVLIEPRYCVRLRYFCLQGRPEK